jgi:hypothetical protein
MQGLFEWMGKATADQQHVTSWAAREKAVRVFWWAALLHIEFGPPAFSPLLPPPAPAPAPTPSDPSGGRGGGGKWAKKQQQQQQQKRGAAGGRGRGGGRGGGGGRLGGTAGGGAWIAPPHQPSSSSSYRTTKSTVGTTTTLNQAQARRGAALASAISMLQNFQMAVTVPDNVMVQAELFFPFDVIWIVTQDILSRIGGPQRDQKREWFKELLSSSAVTVAATLLNDA